MTRSVFSPTKHKPFPSCGKGVEQNFDKLKRLSSETSAGATHIYTYDKAGNRRTTTYAATGRYLVSSYDKVGNLLKVVESYGRADVKARTVTNTYDHAYRLFTETLTEVGGTNNTTAYGYDKVNNRTSKVVTGSSPSTETITYGQLTDGYNSNQLKSVTKGTIVTTFLYDNNGNRTFKKLNGLTIQTHTYDHENRLTTLTDTTKGTFTYTYDHRTRRVGRDETQASGQSTELSFSGGLSVQEYTTGTGIPTVETIRGSDYGGGIGGVLYTIRSGARSYNAYNSRGDVVSQTDDTSAITWQSTYEAYGTRTQEQGTTADRQKANTKDEDPTGLLNEGMRYRDLEFWVFLTRDAAGFVDGPNVYSYVRQNPWTMFDPIGLDMKGAADAAQSMLSHVEHVIDNPAHAIDAAIEGITALAELGDAAIDKLDGNDKSGEAVGDFVKGFHPIVAAEESAEALAESGLTKNAAAAVALNLIARKIPGMKGKGDEIMDSVTKNADNLIGSARDVQKKSAAAVERAKNLEKGIPANHLGPSGKPKVHVVKKATDKQAEDAARLHGKGKPEKHTQDAGQPTQYHGVDRAGEKLKGKDNVHFQKRGEKPNPPKEERGNP